MRACLIVLIALFAGPRPAFADSEPLAVVVGASARQALPKVQELSLIFLRKKLFWANGTRIQAVNLPADHPLRKRFSLQVLKSLPEAQTQYWNGQYYHGVFPPHVVASPEAMLRYVADTPGAIGYLSACQLDARVKAIFWIDDAGSVAAQAPAYDCP